MITALVPAAISPRVMTARYAVPRTGERRSSDGVDVVGDDCEPVERNDNPVTEPSGMSEARPRHWVGAKVVVSTRQSPQRRHGQM